MVWIDDKRLFLGKVKKLVLIITIFCGLAVLFTPSLAFAGGGQSVNRTFQPSSADSYIDANLPNQNYGTLAYMNVSNKNPVQRSLVQFDLSSVPAGSTISSATLYLYASTAASGRTYGAYRITSSWTETAVTYTNQPSIAGAATSTAGSGTTMSFSVLADLQAWIQNQTATNYGWLIKDQSEGTGTPLQTSIYTREEGTQTTLRPKLSITYTAPWDSYQSDYSTVDDLYDQPGDIIYMKGTGFTAGSYKVRYYDASATQIGTDDNITISGGQDLQSSLACNTDINATPGTWNAKVYLSDGTTLVGDDTFTVTSASIPEFPTIFTGIGVAGLCSGMYWWMKKRRQSYVKI